MEGDLMLRDEFQGYEQFQSTPSAWRETENSEKRCLLSRNFNPLPPHGGRRYTVALSGGDTGISIHSLRMEGDCRHVQGVRSP